MNLLPFLKPKRETGITIIERPSDKDGSKPVDSQEESDQGLIACAEDFIRAVHAKDAKATAAAFRAAFEILEMEPHDEVDHEESEQSE